MCKVYIKHVSKRKESKEIKAIFFKLMFPCFLFFPFTHFFTDSGLYGNSAREIVKTSGRSSSSES